MIQKLLTLFWFLLRPLFWGHALQLLIRKFLTNYDTLQFQEKASKWALDHEVSHYEALAKLGINGDKNFLSDAIIKEGQELAKKSAIVMGGPGDINLLFDAVRLTKAKCVIETGVAYGWSSLAILNAMSINDCGNLYSIDMPYPKIGNEDFVGIVVPERLRNRWTLIREPDRYGLEKAIEKIGGSIDLCHYDSDKSWWGRDYAFPLLWNALKPGGLFISDDIQDNMYFAEFVISKSLSFAVTKSEGKFVGLIRKNGINEFKS
jgi:predicted O-methyltransferase YrrM